MAVIGAGPYGLSVAAHLGAQGTPYVIFGKTMESWERHMPAGMHLKSPWGTASSLSHPRGIYSLDRYLAAGFETAGPGPIPLDLFLDYGRWFQERAVPEVDPTAISAVDAEDGCFRLSLEDGRSVRVGRVVVASGIRGFARIPVFAEEWQGSLVSHTIDHRDLSPFSGKSVAVVGCGQSGLEAAALLHESGATVELIVRGRDVTWINHGFWKRGPAKRVLYAPSDVGPALLSWLIAYPLAYRRLPRPLRVRGDRRAMRPAGAPWLRDRVEGRFPITLETSVVRTSQRAGGLRLQLSDGSGRQVDHLMLGTGFRPDLARVPFLSPSLRDRVACVDGLPVLNRHFESSVPGLHFAGALAVGTFGPLFRFVAGAQVAARQIAAAAAG